MSLCKLHLVDALLRCAQNGIGLVVLLPLTRVNTSLARTITMVVTPSTCTADVVPMPTSHTTLVYINVHKQVYMGTHCMHLAHTVW